MKTKNLNTQMVNLLSLICPVALTILIVASSFAQHAPIY